MFYFKIPCSRVSVFNVLFSLRSGPLSVDFTVSYVVLGVSDSKGSYLFVLIVCSHNLYNKPLLVYTPI